MSPNTRYLSPRSEHLEEKGSGDEFRFEVTFSTTYYLGSLLEKRISVSELTCLPAGPSEDRARIRDVVRIE
jgi:hypothetical protein